uniref:SET domain-containing protein n=1 Tax=Acrobeloides nanus TaxID=290746 RepID=A0A914D9L4_9BILA
MSRIVDKVLFLEEHGDKFGWEKHRKWTDLMGHQEELRADEARYAYFQKILGKMKAFRKEEMIDEDKFFDIYCRSTINSHSIHTNAGEEIGISLDLGVSAYDHCCRPNCSMVFDGFVVFLRPLTPDTDPFNFKTSFISYIDVGRSRYQRHKELQSKWYFTCACDRCTDHSDDLLTSLKCTNSTCDEPLVTSETAEPMMISCARCKTIADEDYVKKGQEMMLSLPASYSLTSDVEVLKTLLDSAGQILHQKNIYLCRLKTAIFHITG